MTAYMTDEIYPHAAGPLVLQVSIKAQGPEVALKFAAEEGRGLAAAGVAGALRAEEDEVIMGARAAFKGR